MATYIYGRGAGIAPLPNSNRVRPLNQERINIIVAGRIGELLALDKRLVEANKVKPAKERKAQLKRLAEAYTLIGNPAKAKEITDDINGKRRRSKATATDLPD